MQGHLKINIYLFSALCPPQLHKLYFAQYESFFLPITDQVKKEMGKLIDCSLISWNAAN